MRGINPSHNYVVAEPLETSDDTTASGLLLVRKTDPDTHMATVLATGPASDIVFEAGRIIIYKPYAATKIKLDDKEYLLLDVHDIYGVVHE